MIDTKEEYNKSINLWVFEQENLISTLELNVSFLEKEIVLKQKALELYKESLDHEKQFLSNYLKLQ